MQNKCGIVKKHVFRLRLWLRQKARVLYCPWIDYPISSSQAWRTKVHIHLPSKSPWVEWGSINPWLIEACSNRSQWSLYNAVPMCLLQKMWKSMYTRHGMNMACYDDEIAVHVHRHFAVKTMRFNCLSIKLVGDIKTMLWKWKCWCFDRKSLEIW